MKVFWGLALYMAIGGAITGAFLNHEARRCGSPIDGKVSDFAAMASSWPALIAAAFVVNKKLLGDSKCDAPNQPEVKA